VKCVSWTKEAPKNLQGTKVLKSNPRLQGGVRMKGLGLRERNEPPMKRAGTKGENIEGTNRDKQGQKRE